ncbi:MAG: hypothetical protein Pars2KO_17290 [Parasphingorhabdus sp.]
MRDDVDLSRIYITKFKFAGSLPPEAILGSGPSFCPPTIRTALSYLAVLFVICVSQQMLSKFVNMTDLITGL